jgi:hypothetical protein
MGDGEKRKKEVDSRNSMSPPSSSYTQSVATTFVARPRADQSNPSFMPVRFSVEQYDEMIRRGILAEDARCELIDGIIVRKDRSAVGEDPISIGLSHAYTVDEIGYLKPIAAKMGLLLRTQQPILIGDFSKPEPDAYVAIGSNATYLSRDVHAGDLLLVIEVADSSLDHDRTEKLRLYASAGIALYLILNLVDKVGELYVDPDSNAGSYRRSSVHPRTENLRIDLARLGSIELPLSRLIPE